MIRPYMVIIYFFAGIYVILVVLVSIAATWVLGKLLCSLFHGDRKPKKGIS